MRFWQRVNRNSITSYQSPCCTTHESLSHHQPLTRAPSSGNGQGSGYDQDFCRPRICLTENVFFLWTSGYKFPRAGLFNPRSGLFIHGLGEAGATHKLEGKDWLRKPVVMRPCWNPALTGGRKGPGVWAGQGSGEQGARACKIGRAHV